MVDFGIGGLNRQRRSGSITEERAKEGVRHDENHEIYLESMDGA
jgi:hypothetical protein